MSDTRSTIIDAAIDLVSRHGVKRTSMADVAARSGVSRQTLYVNFPKKDDLLAAAMLHFVRQLQAAMSAEWTETTSLSDVLDIYMKHAVYAPFKLIRKQPEIIDLIHGVGEETRKVAQQIEKEKAELLANQLEPYRARLKAKGSDPLKVGRFIVKTTTELKSTVTSVSELETLIDTLKLAVEALIES